MNLEKVFQYYSREDVQQAIFGLSDGREVVGVFDNGSYSSRPNSLVYKQDIPAMVRSGVREFHCSIERWSNPMGLRMDNYESLRAGWDLVLDIDCDVFEHGKIAAGIFIRALEKHGIRTLSVKFSGGTGFHIAIPWASMPKRVNYKDSSSMFPQLPRTIASYLKHFIRDDLEKALLKTFSAEQLAQQVNRPLDEILTDEGIDPFKIVDTDPILISPRHLFRMPYSLNKNTNLVSVPLNPADIQAFERENASPEKIDTRLGFLDKDQEDEASLLVAESLDWNAKQAAKEKMVKRERPQVTSAISLDYAPPCIKNILVGLSDGKKRSIFVLINYLSSVGWKLEDIESLLLEWNNKNSPPLGESYITSQIRWHRGKVHKPPPNCVHEGWYASFGVCTPDDTCGGQKKTIRNPLNYPFKKMEAGRKSNRPKRNQDKKG